MDTKSNQENDSNTVPQTTTTELPDDIRAIISDLLVRQQQWQQQQSKSEELIARMADQLEQSQRVIQSLAAGPPASPAPVKSVEPRPAEPVANVRSPVADPGMSWERQKALLMSGHSIDAPAQVRTESRDSSTPVSAPAPSNAPPPPDPKEESQVDPVCPKGLSLEARIEHEMDLLEEGGPSGRIRWLKARLEHRLRESEIEISIERARIIREKRELDRLRSEFEEEVLRMREEDSPNGKRSRKDSSDRWSKFLGG